LAGHLAVATGNRGQGLRLLEIASKSERRLTYTEPPYYPRPVAEVAGRVALKMNKPGVAERDFRAALQQYPADSHAVEGLHAALAQSGKPVVAGF
jgi:Flp pilus assembly protein TadD